MTHLCSLLLTLTVLTAHPVPRADIPPARTSRAQAAQTRPPPSGAAPALDRISERFEALAQRVSPSIVQILTTGYGPIGAETPTTSTLLGTQRSGGSGVIVDAAGFIVTNLHVVLGARRVRVMLNVSREIGVPPHSIIKPQGKTVDARVVGADSETDLAVIKIDEPDLSPLAFADSDALRQGQLVFAFGSPFGLDNSVTMGVVSAVARQRRLDDPMVYVQTDAPINPGNSGGPLVDASGAVVGINTFIVTESGGSEGVGFAAPSNIVRTVIDQIRARGRVRRGVIGVNAQTVTPSMAGGLGLPQDWGVLVGDVYPGSPAAVAGLQIGDIILALDNKPMENARQFDVNLYRHAVGDSVSLDVLRGTERTKVSVAVSERADDPDRFLEMVTPDRNLVPRLGILGIDVDNRIAAMLTNPRRTGGVLVAAQAADSLSTASGLMPGDVILGVNKQPILGLAGLRTALDTLAPRTPCVVQVQRGPRLMFIAFEIE